MHAIHTYDQLEQLGRVRLSRSFFMRDFLHSEIAAWHGLRNRPHDADAAIAAGRQLCVQLLEPLQATFGRLHVRSGYRSPEVNDYGNQHDLNCASNEANRAAHIWDLPDAQGKRGATACIVVPWLVDHVVQGGAWTSMAWWIHDHLPYSRLTFFPKLCAFNIQWHEDPVRRIDSYAAPRGCLTRPGMANHVGSHAEAYAGYPRLIDVPDADCAALTEVPQTIKPAPPKAATAKVFYRAVHSRTNWRKVNSHQSMASAIHGKDGAAGLFARKVRVDYATHGDPLYVIVWSSGSSAANLIAPGPGTDGLQIVSIPLDRALAFEHAGGASMQELERLMQEAT